jgi:hypothetical protein
MNNCLVVEACTAHDLFNNKIYAAYIEDAPFEHDQWLTEEEFRAAVDGPIIEGDLAYNVLAERAKSAESGEFLGWALCRPARHPRAMWAPIIAA